MAGILEGWGKPGGGLLRSPQTAQVKQQPTFSALPETMPPLERSLLDYHRKNLTDGTFLKDEQGLTTVYITGVSGPDGRIYNVPGYADGRRLTPEEASQRAETIGWENFPSYATGPESNVAAQSLHQYIEQDGSDFMRLRGMLRPGVK